MRPGLIVRLVILAVSLLAAPPAAHAQPSPKIPRISLLGRTLGSAGCFLQALRDLCYCDDQSVAIGSRWAEGLLESLPDLAAELVRLQPDLLVAISHRVALAAKAATSPGCYGFWARARLVSRL